MKTLLLLLASIVSCGTALGASPSSINNDDSCDIKVGPAATLLLPYFEVDVNGTSGRTTLFTVTNVSRYPQIVHVTLWSDWSYPLLTFNLFLTGYDIQSINLADILIRGTIATPTGTTTATPGSLSSPSDGNLRTPIDCGGSPAVLPASVTAEGELIRFDEHENAASFYCQPTSSPICPAYPWTRSLASSTSSASTAYPSLIGPDVGGWLYLNLDNGGSAAYSVTHEVDGVPVATNKLGRPGQNWVTVTMFGNSANGQMTAELDAASIFNGCSPAVINSRNHFRSGPIPPIDNVFACPPGTTLTNGTTALCTGTNVNPKP